jgi:two-component system, NarL family, sensor kinase
MRGMQPTGNRTAAQVSTDHRWWPTALAVVVTVIGLTAVVSMLASRPVHLVYERWLFHTVPMALFTAWLGRVLIRRSADRWLGLLFLFVSGMWTLHATANAVADRRLAAVGLDTNGPLVPADLPLPTAVALWFAVWLWLPPLVVFPLMLLRFPDGVWPGREWRLSLPVFVTGQVMTTVAFMAHAWPTRADEFLAFETPAAEPYWSVAMVGFTIMFAGLAGATASLATRWHRADLEQRHQIRAIGVTATLLGVTIVALWPWPRLSLLSQMVAGVAFLAAYTLAVLRYRLHNLDIAINRTVVASVLAVLVTGIYLAVVVGVGGLVGRTAENPLLPLMAVGLVAVLFEPARRRVRRLVDRLLYGRDADAYQVLSGLASQLRDAGSISAVTSRVTRLLVRGTGAAGAKITMLVDGVSRTLAAAGDVGTGQPVLAEAIVHDGQHLGEVAVYARSTSDLAPDAPALLRDVAGTLGTVLRNEVLTDTLRAQVDELRRSRYRLITAQDQARRELERDLHDGAQVRLLALRLQLSLVTSQADTLPDSPDAVALRATVDRLGAAVDAAIRTIRDLARGLHPPVLETEGLAPALRAAARGLPVDILISAERIGRFAPQVEAAAFFCCLEAIRNAAAHANAGQVRVEFANGDGRLHFSVEDDGHGFDPDVVSQGRGLSNLDDRIAGLGGRLTIDAAPGRGTRILGEVPGQPLVSDR